MVFAFPQEHIGQTFATIISNMKGNPVLSKHYGDFLEEKGKAHFAKYMFEIAYNLLAMNREGLCHADLHLNNATIGRLYEQHDTVYPGEDYAKKVKEDEAKIDESFVMYSISEELQFVFPNSTYFAGIIDFSRVIINPAKIENFRDRAMPASYAPQEGDEELAEKESRVLLNLYMQVFPNKEKRRDEYAIVFRNHFQAVFKLLTAMDLYMFTVRLSRQLQGSGMKIYKPSIDLLIKINKLAEGFITEEMGYLVQDPAIHEKKVLEGEWPLFTILKKCFPEYLHGAAFDEVRYINDVYMLDHPIKYDLREFKDLPPYMKEYQVIKNGKVIEGAKAFRVFHQKLSMDLEKQRRDNLDMVSYIAMRYQEKEG